MTSPEAGLPGNIGAPATRALTAAGYTRLSQLANVPAAELKKLHGVGPKALRLLQEALEQHGMSLGKGMLSLLIYANRIRRNPGEVLSSSKPGHDS